MTEVKAFLPGEEEPTDLIGYADYVAVAEGFGRQIQVSEYVLVEDDGDCTEVRPVDWPASG